MLLVQAPALAVSFTPTLAVPEMVGMAVFSVPVATGLVAAEVFVTEV